MKQFDVIFFYMEHFCSIIYCNIVNCNTNKIWFISEREKHKRGPNCVKVTTLIWVIEGLNYESPTAEVEGGQNIC